MLTISGTTKTLMLKNVKVAEANTSRLISNDKVQAYIAGIEKRTTNSFVNKC